MRVNSSGLVSDRHCIMPANYAHSGGRLMLPKPSDYRYTNMWEWKYILRGHGHGLAFPFPLDAEHV